MKPILLTALLALLCGQLHAADSAVRAKPNIVLILADDVGLGDVHCTGGPWCLEKDHHHPVSPE